MKTQPTEFTLSNDEQVVRTYECTSLRRWFAKPTLGHLTVTNKRLVYHSSAASRVGSSTLISEMPVEDVAGISSLVGSSINWFFFLIFAGVLFFITQLIIQILPGWLTSWPVSLLLMLPLGIAWLIEKRIISQEIIEQVMNTLDQSPAGAFLKKKDASFYNSLFQILFIIGAIFLAYTIGFNTRLGRNLPPLAYALMLAIYFWIYMRFFGRNRTFSLMVTSKTSKGSGIYIPGDPMSIFWGRDNTAVRTLSAGPARDAETIVKELGAMLTDIQQLGDLGIQKWSQ